MNTMLAEALATRADLQRRIEGMRAPLGQSALVQEGEVPPEDLDGLLLETEGIVLELERIVGGINRTNLTARLGDGATLTEAPARRDALALRHGPIGALVGAASDRVPRYGRTEIRILPTVEVGPLRRQVDELAKERRQLDTSIQEANWGPPTSQSSGSAEHA